jgi:hypothetical protein
VKNQYVVSEQGAGLVRFGSKSGALRYAAKLRRYWQIHLELPRTVPAGSRRGEWPHGLLMWWRGCWPDVAAYELTLQRAERCELCKQVKNRV